MNRSDRHGPARTRRLGPLLLSAVLATPAMAEPATPEAALTGMSTDNDDHAEHLHEPLNPTASLSLRDVVDRTVVHYPSQSELVARMAERDALRSAGAGWLSAAPSVFFSHLNDSPLDDLDQREFDLGMELPLWRLGQKQAARDLGESASAETQAAAAALRWQVAGLVRSTLWDIAVATNALELAEESVVIAGELVRVVERRVEAGDLPASDALLAQTTLYEKQIAVIDREAEVLDAERAYRSLTALDERPTAFTETHAAKEAFDDSHPALALVMAEIGRARANRLLTEKSSRGYPSLTIAPHRQRDPLGTFYSNSLTVEYRLPVGGDRYGAVTRAQAGRAVAEVEARRGILLRQLDLALHEAEHDLYVVEQSIEVVSDRAALAERQWTMGQTAFELGELDFRDLLRVQETRLEARRDLRRLEILQGRAIAMINQALGELP